jgi:hypothetical protein
VRDTSNLEAYNLYLLERYHWSKQANRNWDPAVHDFEAAIRLDYTYARAHPGLGNWDNQPGQQPILLFLKNCVEPVSLRIVETYRF